MLVVHHGLAADLPAYVVLLHGVGDLRGPLGEVVVRLDALEEGMAIPIRVQGRLDGVLVPLSERCHTRARSPSVELRMSTVKRSTRAKMRARTCARTSALLSPGCS